MILAPLPSTTFGATPHQVLIDARLDRAKQLLLAADLPVTQICQIMLAIFADTRGNLIQIYQPPA